MCSKLPKLGQCTDKKKFRGNFMFASIEQIVRKRPTSLCDLYSLLCVAYYFVNGTLPWIDHIDRQVEQQSDSADLFQPQNFIKIRMKMSKEFDKELIAKGAELGPLFSYLQHRRKKYEKLQQQLRKAGREIDNVFKIDYAHMIDLLPKEVQIRSDEIRFVKKRAKLAA